MFEKFWQWLTAKPGVEPLMFNGVDLNKWYYLGHWDISFVDRDDVPHTRARIYFFREKDTDRRRIAFQSDLDKYVQHEFAQKHPAYHSAKEWASGVREFWAIPWTPSHDLIQRMKEMHNETWDHKKKVWIALPPETTKDGNIITLDFKKEP